MKAPVEAGGSEAASDPGQALVVASEMLHPVSKGLARAGYESCVAGAEEPSVKHGLMQADTSARADDVERGVPAFFFSDAVLQFELKCEFFKVLHVVRIGKQPFSVICQKVAQLEISVFQLGVSLLQLLLCSPRDGEPLCLWFVNQLCSKASPPIRVRDLFPIPCPPVGAALKLIQQATVADDGILRATNLSNPQRKKQGRQQRKRLFEEGTKQIWRCICVMVLNGLGDGWKFFSKTHGCMTEHQKGAMQVVTGWVEGFCESPGEVFPKPDFAGVVKNRQMDYSGEEVATALPLRLEELLPGLPVSGVAGSLSAVQAAAGGVREWVADPGLTLKPKELWPARVPHARINATKSEWYRVCQVLYQRGIIEPIPYEKIFRVNNTPVLNGAFAVEEKGKAGVGQSRVTRLIMNFIPANLYQKLMRGDLNTLAGSSAWCQLVLENDEVLLWSGDDQKGAFYAWQLPLTWRPYMAFRWPVPGHLVGSQQPLEYVASRVIPMGWIQAVSLFQHLHRQLGMAPVPHGAGHAEELEWRRDKPTPQRSGSRITEFIQFYLDDFDCPELVPSEGWEDLRGVLSASHRKQREAYRRWGVGIAEDKAHIREPRVVRMGAEIHGKRGTVSVPRQKKLEVAYFAFWTLGLRCPPTKVLLMVLGRLVRCFEFRRPLMTLLATVWPKGPVQMRRPWAKSSVQEILWAVAALPLAGTDLRAGVSDMVTCSDASEVGGGLCASGSLTAEGEAVLKQLQSPVFVKERVGYFQPQGALPVDNSQGPRVIVVSLFDGISALMCGLCRLRCQVVAFCASEVDKACKRLVRQRWPGVIELGDICGISHSTIETLAASVGDGVDLVLCGGGSPCQDLSSLLADRAGLQGQRSKLFFEMPRIFRSLREVFRCPVHRFVENVFSMTVDNRAQFTETLGFEPVLLDSVHFSPCRRPRLFWIDWNIQPRGEETLQEHEGYKEWVVRAPDMTSAWWLDKLAQKDSLDPLPTFTRALPRKTPPRQPAGIASASAEAIQRWKEDQHRFQVYQYEEKHMIRRPDGVLRLPSLMEREKAMGFPQGYVSNGMSPKLTLREAFNQGACMIGNSFNVYAITLLMDELLRNHDPNYVARPLDRIFERNQTAPAGWCETPNFDPQTRPDSRSKMMVQELLRHADKNGCDVKLDVGIPFRTRAWPRAGIRSRLFHWRIIHGYRWKFDSHINLLELQAVVNALQWRLRSVSRFRHRVLHLVDSQVVASIVAKGRTSSFRLRKAVDKLASLCIAGGVHLAIGYIASEENPADIPSRWAKQPKSKLKRIGKKGKDSGPGSPCKTRC